MGWGSPAPAADYICYLGTENRDRAGPLCTDAIIRYFKRKGGRVHIITFRVTTKLWSKSNRRI